MSSYRNSNVLVTILQGLIYVAAFVPWIIFSNFISPFHFGKVIVFRSLVEVMLVFYILLIWADRSYLPKINNIFWSFFAFVVAFSITTITSIIPYASFWGSLERMGGLFTFWHYFLYFIVLTSVFRTEKDWLRLFNVVILVGIGSAFYGFLQRTEASFIVGSGNRLRIFGTIGNPALFAGYQIVCLFLSGMLFFRKNNSVLLRNFYAFGFIVMTIAALMTAVRGSVLAIGVGFMAFSLLYSSVFRSKNARKVFLGIIGTGLVLVTLGLMLKNTDFVQNSSYLRRVTDFSLTSFTVKTRFWAWEAGIKGWTDGFKTIVFGWGPENFNIPFSKYFNPNFFQGIGSETLFDRAHNMFVEILVTMGLVGFLAYVFIFASAFRVLWKNVHSKNPDVALYGVGLIVLIIAYIIHNFFIFDTSANFLVFFTILGFISFLVSDYNGDGQNLQNQKPVPARTRRINPVILNLTGAVLLVVSFMAVYYINVLPAKANYATTRGILKSWEGDTKGAIQKFQESLSYNVPGKYEYRNRFAQYVLEATNSATLTPEIEQLILLAVDEVKKNIDENPPDYLPYLYVSRLYIILGRTDSGSEYNDKALEMSKKALELSPTFVRTYYEIGQAFLNKGDLDGAAEYFKKAAELNPDVGLSWWYLGIVEIEKGEIDDGLKIIEDILFSGKYSATESDYNRLINLYVQRNEFDKLEFIYAGLVKAKPNNAQYHASYAVVLAQLGKLDQAVAEAKAAAKADVKFEPEAKAFVQSIGRAW